MDNESIFIDPDREEFVNSIQRISPNINDYITTRLYEADVLDSDSITDETIFNLVMNMVVDELIQLGISVDGDIYHDSSVITNIKAVRVYFDKVSLTNLFSRNRKLLEQVSSVLENMEDEYEMLAELLVHQFYASNPVSSVLEHMKDHAWQLTSNVLLYDHVKRIIENVLSDVVESVDEDLIIHYTEAVIHHVNTVTTMLNRVVSSSNKYDKSIVEKQLNGSYDADLPSRIDSVDIIRYIDNADPHPAHTNSEDSDRIKQHKVSVLHHIEYYGNHQLTETELLLVVVDNIRSTWTLEQHIAQLKKNLSSRPDIIDAAVELMTTIVNTMMSN